MKLHISELHGVSAEISEKLISAGLNDSDKLLAAAGPADARKALAAKLGIDERALLELANRSDLARLRGVGKVFSDLLEFAGVDTAVELAKRVPANLFTKIGQVAAEHHVKRLPRLADVESWVTQAKALDRKVHH
jgi:predicted flap endonuclease-1-like 5' DNA nuclease